jgi:hypothetical protein
MVSSDQKYDQSSRYSVSEWWIVLYHCHVASPILFGGTLYVDILWIGLGECVQIYAI